MANAPDNYAITAGGVHLTASSAAAGLFSIQNLFNGLRTSVLIKSTATSAAPSDWDGAWEIAPGDGFFDTTIAKLWPGSTNTYLHCKTAGGPTATANVSFTSA